MSTPQHDPREDAAPGFGRSSTTMRLITPAVPASIRAPASP